MSTNEKILYHQIHPVKLFTDFSTAFLSTFLLWQHMLYWGLLLSFVPSIVVSLILVNTIDLEKYQKSAIGVYAKRYMDSRVVDACRFGGFLLMMIGGWYEQAWLIILGLAIILLCWSRGLLFSRK